MIEPKMNAVASRYDSAGEGYLRYWAPVLEVSARALVDRAARAIDDAVVRAGREGRTASFLDVGTGAGVLALEVLQRWPSGVAVAALDASSGMLDIARKEFDRAGVPVVTRSSAAGSTVADGSTTAGSTATDGSTTARSTVELIHAPAGRIPLPDASVDVAISSFVLQLVPDRGAALSEIRRVLRPGGTLWFVTWLDGELPFEAADAFDDVVVDLDIVEKDDEDDDEEVAGDFRSANAAAGELRRAGFRAVSARSETLEHPWTRESYLDYKRHYGESQLFRDIDAATGEALMRRARERMEPLPPDAFTFRARIVYATGRRP